MKPEPVTVLIIEEKENCKTSIQELLSRIDDDTFLIESTSDISNIPAILNENKIGATLFDLAYQSTFINFQKVKESVSRRGYKTNP